MPTPDNHTRNGFSPRPGIVHRPTRTSLIPSEGPSLPGAEFGPVNGPRENHWTDNNVSQAVRIPTTGMQMPVMPDDVQERLIMGLTNHGHMSPHDIHGAHVTDVSPDGEVTINPDVPPAVVDCINRLVKRLAPTDSE